MTEKFSYRARTPITFYIGLLIIFVVALSTVSRIDFPDSLIYPSIVAVLWFVSISNYACRVVISENKLIVKYLAFWHRDQELNLKNFKALSVRTSYWSFNMRYDTNMFREYIFYDEITFIDLDGKEHKLRINTRLGSLNKLIKKTNFVIFSQK